MLRVHINKQAHEFSEGVTILDAIRSVGFQVPTLCHDERLRPCGNCRTCLVEVRGKPHPVTACNSPLADGMVIETHTPELERTRRGLLRMLARQYPAEAVRRSPGKEFHRQLLRYGVEGESAGAPDPNLVDDSHPYIHVDMSRCILCRRCVRICEEVQGQFVWQVLGRGSETRIVPDSGTTLGESSCVACGACVDTCPTGALEDKTILSAGVPDRWTRTVCPYCGTGCELEAGTVGERIVAARPVVDAPASRGHLCVKGRYAFGFVEAGDRITEPMIRRGGRWETVTWDEALKFTADALRQSLARYGADSVGVLGSARATNEENYLAQKFARAVLGTNNVDCCARVCHAPSAAAMKLMLGTGAATNSFNDIERARTILVCGANPTENHPVVGARIKQAHLRGARLVVIDPRLTELAALADCHLRLRPGTNVPLLNAMAYAVIEERLCDEEFIGGRVAGWEEFKEFIGGYAPESVAGVCGVSAATASPTRRNIR